MKLVMNDAGQLSWSRIVLMLGLTVISGYLASRSQRAGASAVEIPLKARYYHGVQQVAVGQQRFWHEVQKRAATRYDIACL
jgi:hypothetical protein